jgi:hypothetical protein
MQKFYSCSIALRNGKILTPENFAWVKHALKEILEDGRAVILIEARKCFLRA